MNFIRQTILSSIATSRAILFLAAALFFNCDKPSFAKSVSPPSKTASASEDTLYERCTVASCSVFTRDRTQKEKFLLEGNPSTYVQHYRGTLYKIRINCGNPCSGTTYMDLSTGRRAGPFPDVIAEDTTRLLVAHMEKKGVVMDCMLPCKSHPAEFSLPLSPVAAPISAIDTAFFESGRLVVSFATGKNFDTAVDTLEVPDKFGESGDK